MDIAAFIISCVAIVATFINVIINIRRYELDLPNIKVLSVKSRPEIYGISFPAYDTYDSKYELIIEYINHLNKDEWIEGFVFLFGKRKNRFEINEKAPAKEKSTKKIILKRDEIFLIKAICIEFGDKRHYWVPKLHLKELKTQTKKEIEFRKEKSVKGELIGVMIDEQ